MDRMQGVCRAGFALIATLTTLCAAQSAFALSHEQVCEKGRYAAWGKFSQCDNIATSKYAGGGSFASFQAALSKCRVKYVATWPRLERAAAGTGAFCDSARFVDNLDGTVTDKLTGLQWEQKTALPGLDYVNETTTVNGLSDFVATLNGTNAITSFCSSVACLGSNGCDWRIPTASELRTIVTDPCTTAPCIDPVFGPTVTGNYWSSSVLPDNGQNWFVNFFAGGTDTADKSAFFAFRAVRGGLL